MYQTIARSINTRIDLTERQKNEIIHSVFTAAQLVGLIPNPTRNGLSELRAPGGMFAGIREAFTGRPSRE